MSDSSRYLDDVVRLEEGRIEGQPLCDLRGGDDVQRALKGRGAIHVKEKDLCVCAQRQWASGHTE